GRPLRMGGAAQAETVREQAGPVVARPQVGALGETPAPEVFRPLLAVPVVRGAPQPGRQGLLFLGLRLDANHTLIEPGLRREQPLERRARQLAGIPRMVGGELWIADVGPERRNEGQQADSGE